MSPRIDDLRDAFRALAKHPLETASALLILALGIGATSAAFSLVDAVILRPLPYPAPERLVAAGEVTPSGWKIPVSPARWALWRDAPEAFELAAAATEQGFDLTGSGAPERIAGARVSASFFPLLGARAARGRLLLADDDRPDAARVAVVSDGLWRRRFGADPSTVGREIVLTGEPHTVVGILERGFQPPELVFSDPPEVWTALGPRLDPAQSGSYFLQVLGRTPSGVGMEAAQAALEARAPAGSEGFGARLVSLQAETVGPIRTRLLLFFGAVVLVLLAACANVGGILLARGVRRERDLAVRCALGADRRRIAALLTGEGVLLAAGAAALGLGVAAGGVALLRRLLAGDVPRLAEVAIDGRVFAFTVGVAALAVLLSGLLPAWLSARRALASGVRRESRERMALRRLLLVAEVGLAMVLVVGAGLLARSLVALSAVDPGFEPEGRVVLELSADPARYPEAEGRRALFEGVLERVEAAPGVRAAALATTLPFGRGSAVLSFAFPGSDEQHYASLFGVGPGYFRILGIPVLDGRDFSAADGAGSRAAVVSAASARALWPGESAVGRRIPMDGGDALEVVGVVGDVRLQSLADEPGLTLYQPFEALGGARAAVVARVETRPELLAADLRQAVWSVDPDQPVARVAPYTELLGGSLREPRATSALFASFAVLTALLSALGLYGLMAELVTRRTHEIGVRMALGAGRRRVVGLMLRRALALAAVGVAAGALAAYLASRFLESLLFAVAPTDPPTYAAVAGLLLGLAAVAAWAPARRAAATDPAAALKVE